MVTGSPGNFTPRINRTPPDKGSFPIDRENECKSHMIDFLRCLKLNQFDNEACRDFSKHYLECRMDKGLMAREEWSKLGYSAQDENKTSA